MCNYDTTNPTNKSTDLDELLTSQQQKHRNLKAAELCAKHLSEVGLSRMENCGEWLWMLENKSGTKKKLERGFFCGNRFCPACAWRYAAAWGRALCTVDRFLCEKEGLIPIFVTLTVRNVKRDDLRSELKKMALAWDRLVRRKAYRAWKNFARKTEVTYNPERNDYHPHYHVLIWVEPEYFLYNSYVRHSQLLRDWRFAMHDDTITQVRVQRCKSDSSTGAAVAEVAKYVAKSDDYLNHGQDVFDSFYEGLHSVRIISLGGLAKDAIKEYRKGNLMDFQPDKPDSLEEYTIRAIYHWHFEKYNPVAVEEVDLKEEADQKAMAKKLLSEDIQYLAAYGMRSVPLLESPWDEVEE